MRGPPRIYPSSQNIPPFKHLYVTLPDCTPPSQNIHPLLLNILDLYATLPESTPPSQNIPAFYITLLESTLPIFSQLRVTLP